MSKLRESQLRSSRVLKHSMLRLSFTLPTAVLSALVFLTGCSSQKVADRVAVEPLSAPTYPFREAAAESGLDFHHFSGASGAYYMCEMVGPGGALFDADGDGDLDLFLCQGSMLGPDKTLSDAKFPPSGPLGCRLYRNELSSNSAGAPSALFTDVTAAAGIDLQDYCLGAAAGDYDNDGDLDLYVTTYRGGNHLLQNDAQGIFADVTSAAGVQDPLWSSSAAWVDVDHDGRLDLFVCNYVQMNYATHRMCKSKAGADDYCGPQVYVPEPSQLFRNRGDGTFEDLSISSGIALKPGPALGVLCADLNEDGQIDFFVANDGKPNHAWINQGDWKFREEGLTMGCAVSADGTAMAGMGVALGDVDDDGREDLCVTNLRNEQITLYQNMGGGLYVDKSGPSGLANMSRPYTGFGVGLLDFDNDGRLDVFSANGEVRVIDALLQAGDPYPMGQVNTLYRNVENAKRTVTFELVDGGPAMAFAEVSRAAIFGDIDNDGDIDLIVGNNNGPLRLLLNEVGQEKSWVGLRLVTADGKRDAIGARARVECAGQPPQVRRCHTDGSYQSSCDPRLQFGLADATSIEQVIVTWVDGTQEVWKDVPAGKYTTLLQGSGSALPKTE